MRLAGFIQQNMESILQEWEDFAREIQPPHRAMDVAELRDHAEEILREIAEDLGRPRSEVERIERSKGRSPSRDGESAAEIHASLRLASGFSIDQLIAEYRALRTGVLHLWANRSKTATWFEVEDITRFNEAIDQALNESVARYARMERQSQDVFIGILGHDIRTPLNAISMAAEIMMRTESLDGKHIQLASRIFNSSARIGELVTALLDLTRVRFGMQLSLREANIALLAEQVIEEIRSTCPQRTIGLLVSGNLEGTWDSARVSQVLSNLINNAVQHGSDNGPISVSLSGGSDEVVLAVNNIGTPIPEAEIARIFEPLRRYSRTPRDDRNSHSNLGLGLYITREAVIAHGGTINVISNELEGTTFTVHLPKRKGR